MAEFVTAATVRDYLTVTGSSGAWSDSLIGSNIAAACSNLQRWTNRQFEPQGSNTAVTKRFTTRHRSYLTIPDLQVANTVTLHGSTLTQDETYYLIPDRMNTGVFVAIQLPNRRDPGDYRSFSGWFDRNYDRMRFHLDDIPNDLEITGVWGHPVYPDPVLHAAKVLAAYYTLRPNAVLGGVSLTTQGTEVDLSQLPREVQDFVRDWYLGDYM